MTYINLTHFPIRLVDGENINYKIHNWLNHHYLEELNIDVIIPPCGTVAWVQEYYQPHGYELYATKLKKVYGDIQRLPGSVAGVQYIVNDNVYEAAVILGRKDVRKVGIPIIDTEDDDRIVAYFGLVAPE